jgi:8-oxo-dGTP diphosphatase
VIYVTAGLIFRQGKLLITRRPEHKPGALKWEFPGGKIEDNEDPRLCLAREVREELAVDIEVGRVIDIVFHRYPDRSVVLLFFECRWVSGEPVPLGCSALAWVAPADLPQYDFLEADLDFIRRFPLPGSGADPSAAPE